MIRTFGIVSLTNEDEDNNENLVAYLRHLAPESNLQIYDNWDECIDFITDATENSRQIDLIISLSSLSEINESLQNLIQELSNIDSVYILCRTVSSSTNFRANNPKIHGIYKDYQSLINELLNVMNVHRSSYRRFASDNFAVATMAPLLTSAITTASSDTSDINHQKDEKKQEVECMYSQLARDILMSAESNKTEMLDFCRQQYADDKTQLRFIQEFEEHYQPQKAIFWYTRDTFLYRLLNKALRENDIDTLYSLRYFIKDLHCQIEDFHAKQMVTNTRIITLYRGQLIKTDEFEQKVKHNLNGFLSVTSFLSTTMFKELAIIFAGNGTEIDTQSVLFQIDIDQSVQNFPYANISTESDFGDVEGEILFTMGSVFRILSIKSIGKNMWSIHLKLTGEEDEELKNLTKYMRGGLDQFTPEIHLARLLFEMAEYHKAIKYLQKVMQDSQVMNDPIICFYVNNELGDIYERIGERNISEEYYWKALKVNLEHLPENHLALMTADSIRALLHKRTGDLEQTLVYYNKMLESSFKYREGCEADSDYRNIAMIYAEQERYSEAMEMCYKALDIQFKTLPKNHPSFAETYHLMSKISAKQNKSDESIQYLEKTLEIQQHSIPSGHPSFIATYYGLDKFKEALECIKKKNQLLIKQLPEISQIDVETTRTRYQKLIEDANELLEILRQRDGNDISTQKSDSVI